MRSIIILLKSLLEECDKEVTGAATASCVRGRLQNVLSNVTYSPSHRHVSTPAINIQSSLRTAPDLCKNISLAVLFRSNGDSCTLCAQSDTCRPIYTYSSQYRDAGWAKEIKKNWDKIEFRVRLWARVP